MPKDYQEEVIGHCSECNRRLTSVYFGVNKIEKLFDWHCLCFVAGAKPVFTTEVKSELK
jgi:hypothetical protein